MDEEGKDTPDVTAPPCSSTAQCDDFEYEEFSHATAAFWETELSREGQWYGKAAQWWVDNCPPTINGVLGGYGELDECDVKESAEFLETLKKAGAPLSLDLALDVGAGIGRVTRNLLSRFFSKVDLVEGNQRLLGSVPDFLGKERQHCLGEMYCSTMQDFTPSVGTYDCVWLQWCIIYLTDADLALFLRRCARALRPGGLIVIKENMLDDGDGAFLKDEDDSSVTRTEPLMLHIFQQAGLDVFAKQRQIDFPPGMFKVMMYALRPKVH